MHAFYINLDSRTDRRQQFEEECRKMNIDVERFSAVARNPGALGCAYSHRDVIQLAKDRGYPRVIVFEDDFQFLVGPDVFEDVMTHLPEDFDVVMLAYGMEKADRYNDRFGRVLEACNGAGYVVSSKFYDQLLHTWNEALVNYEQQQHCHWQFINDQSWKPLQPNSRWYYSLQRIGKQRPSWSDLSGRFVDYGN